MENLFKQLRENWVILVAIAGLIVSWTTFSSNLADAQSDIKANASKIETIESKQATADSRFQNLEANVFILCSAQNLHCIPPIK